VNYHRRGLDAAVVRVNAIPRALRAINGAAGQGEIGDGCDSPSPLQVAGRTHTEALEPTDRRV